MTGAILHFSLFGDILDGLLNVLEQAATAVINVIIAALAVVLSALFSVLPDMPDLPDPPDALVTAESWVAWFFPVGTVIDALAFVLAMYIIWQVVALALRWAKGIGDA